MCAPKETPTLPSTVNCDYIVPQDNQNLRQALFELVYERLQQLQLRMRAVNGIQDDVLDTLRQDIRNTESNLNAHARHYGYFDEQ